LRPSSRSHSRAAQANAILKQLSLPWILLLCQDSFYKSLNAEQSKLAFENRYNFDSPLAIDHEVLLERVKDLKALRSCEIPVYSFVQHQRLAETQYIYGGSVVIVEGIFALHDPKLRDLLDLKIFVQCDSDLMLARRIKRDILERGRDVAGRHLLLDGFNLADN
jgi:uridine kinase